MNAKRVVCEQSRDRQGKDFKEKKTELYNKATRARKWDQEKGTQKKCVMARHDEREKSKKEQRMYVQSVILRICPRSTL